jgi:hypothetical protein
VVRIRLVEIENFRGVKSLRWAPKDGINCLIGPGDSCKTTILDAIDYCLGARRFAQFTDADFHKLDVEQPVSISCTLGALSDRLKNIEAYGLYLRAFDPSTETVEDEPRKGTETALTVIRECEDHGWMRDRADPHARERAFAIAREEPPPGVSSEVAAVVVADVLDGIGDACPECETTDSELNGVG